MLEVLPVYRSTRRVARLHLPGRLVAGLVAATSFAVLIIAWKLPPDPYGVGTHEQLGLAPCGFLQTFGRPCPMCGMTTSYAHFARGHLTASYITQPAGLVLAIVTVLTFWLSAYAAVTGVSLGRLILRRVNVMAILWISLAILGAGWAWKVATFARG